MQPDINFTELCMGDSEREDVLEYVAQTMAEVDDSENDLEEQQDHDDLMEGADNSVAPQEGF